MKLKEWKSDQKQSDNGKQSKLQTDNDREAAASPGASPIGSLHRSRGNQAVQQLYRNGLIQAKLSVSQPSDEDEQEAEQVAERVMHMSATESPIVSGNVDGIIRTGSSGGTAVEGEAEKQIESVKGGGKPLPPAGRSFFELRFGRDFSDVRVHSGPRSNEAARSIDADAFTYGNDLVFKSGKYNPNTKVGKKLLAHELTHVVQQELPQSTNQIQRQTPKKSGKEESEDDREVTSPFATLGGKAKSPEGKEFDTLVASVVNHVKSWMSRSQSNKMTLIVEGQASKEGDESYNMGLSLDRAKNVKKNLRESIDSAEVEGTVNIETRPLGEGEHSEANYWKDRRATVIHKKETVQVTESGGVLPRFPSHSRSPEEKIEYIRENADDPLVKEAFRINAIKRAIGDLKPYPTEWDDFKIRGKDELYKEIALDAYDYVMKTRRYRELKEAMKQETGSSKGDSTTLQELGTIYFPHDQADPRA